MLSATFNTASAQESDDLNYNVILNSYLEHNNLVAIARFYDTADEYQLVPIFEAGDTEASTVISREDGALWAIKKYARIGDDYFQMFSGGFTEAIGALKINSLEHCTADGKATILLRAIVRPSMSDLALSDAKLSDIEFSFSKLFNDYVQQELRTIDYTNTSGNFRDQILFPALTNAATEFEARYDITIADRNDLIVYRGISVNDLRDLPRQDRERICPNPSQKL